MTNVTLKRCRGCAASKLSGDFSPDARARDGCQSRCKACVAEARREAYRNDAEVRDRVLRRTREWSLKNPESGNAAKRRYYEANRQEAKQRATDWNRANPGRRAELCARWARENPGKVVEIVQRRNARKRQQTPLDADFAAIQAVYERAARMTRATGIRYEVDHIKPLSRGGLHHQDNLQILTKTENCKKGSRLIG